MIKFLRWFFGFSEFKIEGEISSFVSMFGNVLWNVHKTNGFFYANCLTKNYEKIFNEAKNCSCYLTKIRDFGFLNKIKKYVFRKGLLVGLTVFVLILFLSSFFVWDVELRGNVLIPDEDIFRVCDQSGLHAGSLIFGVDENKIEYRLKKEFESIAWVSVNRLAGKYVIEIKEGEPKPEMEGVSNRPCNVVAEFDGVVLSVKPRSGFVHVRAGDKVKKNQVLISAVDEYERSGDVMLAHSDGEIVARVERFNEVKLPILTKRKNKTGIKQKQNSLELLGLKIPLESKRLEKNFKEVEKYREPIEFLGIRLPIFCETKIYEKIDEVNVVNNSDILKRMLLNEQKKWEIKNLSGDQILSRNYRFRQNGHDIVLRAKITVNQRIDKKQPVYVDNDRVLPVVESSE